MLIASLFLGLISIAGVIAQTYVDIRIVSAESVAKGVKVMVGSSVYFEVKSLITHF
jgi:hypothetical protein